MKYFSLLLLVVTANLISTGETPHHRFTHVAGTDIIDGHTPGVDADVIAKMFQVRNAINRLLQGEKKDGVVVKKYNYRGTFIALNDLIKIEEDLEAQGIKKNDPRYNDAQGCLYQMIEDIIAYSDSLLENEAAFIQKLVSKIIHDWAHRSGRHNSLLLQWGAEDEKETFRKISAKELVQFCSDLKNFFFDLMFSCPKAREQFKEKYLSEEKCGSAYIKRREMFDRTFHINS